MKKNKLCLLGGSNSVMKHGLSFGLCNKNDLQLPLGASSSIQNLHELITNKEQILATDVIVTESNVNDIYNIQAFHVDQNCVMNNIRYFYDELYRIGKPVIALILPTKFTKYNRPLCEEVNKLHIELCHKYGFQYINVESIYKKIHKTPSEDYFMPDPRHPVDSYMYELGKNLRGYIFNENTHLKSIRPVLKSNFYVLNKLKEQADQGKENSKYKRALFSTEAPLTIGEQNGYLSAIETWSDRHSQLIIENTKTGEKIIRSFPDNLAFNEFATERLSHFQMTSHFGDALDITEPSVNVKPKASYTSPTLVSSLLFIYHGAKLLEVNHKVDLELIEVLPELSPHIAGVKRYDEKVNAASKNITNKDVLQLRNLALKLEKVDIAMAYQVMTLTAKLRPNGPLIRQKLHEFKKRLKIKN